MKKIHETLYILHKCDRNIMTVWKAILKHQQRGPVYSQYHFTQNLTHYLIMESLSFIDEYKRFFVGDMVENEYATRIETVIHICKPILTQIKKWQTLNDFRNNIIAHPWRKKNKFVIPSSSMYQIPRTWVEFEFLMELVHFIYQIIKAEFAQEIDTAIVLALGLSKDIKPKFTPKDINNAMKKVMDEVNIEMTKFGKDYEVKVYEDRSSTN